MSVNTDGSGEAERGGSRPSVPEERAEAADERDQTADERDQAGDERDQTGDERDQTGDERDQTGDERAEAADERDQTGDERDQTGDERDRAADERDRTGDERDRTGDERDRAADQRDRAADQRDQAADQYEASVGAGITTDALNRSALARREASFDRVRASQDRGAGASDRAQAELDRNIALAGRGAGDSERTHAALDRNTALAERTRTNAVAREATADERERTRRELLRAVIAAQEAERARVSRDLHDDMGQALTSVLLGLGLIDGQSDPDARQRVEELRELVADTLRRARQLAFDLRPTVLDDVGLAPALERLVADMAGRSALVVDAAVDGVPEHEGLAPEVATVVYRVVQEALTNVVRHAEASSASVAVTVSSGRLRAVVEDDGVGFGATRPDESYLGLQGMEERAELVGGTVRVTSVPGSGTTVVLEVPIG